MQNLLESPGPNTFLLTDGFKCSSPEENKNFQCPQTWKCMSSGEDVFLVFWLLRNARGFALTPLAAWSLRTVLLDSIGLHPRPCTPATEVMDPSRCRGWEQDTLSGAILHLLIAHLSPSHLSTSSSLTSLEVTGPMSLFLCSSAPCILLYTSHP